MQNISVRQANIMLTQRTIMKINSKKNNQNKIKIIKKFNKNSSKKIILKKKNNAKQENYFLNSEVLSIINLLFIVRFIYYITFNNIEFEEISDYLIHKEFINSMDQSSFTRVLKFSISIMGLLPILNANVFIQVVRTRNEYIKNLLKNNELKGKIQLENIKRILIIFLSIVSSSYIINFLWPYADNFTDLWCFQTSIKLIVGTFIQLWVIDKIDNYNLNLGLSSLILYNIISTFKFIPDSSGSQYQYGIFLGGIVTSCLIFLIFSISYIQEIEKPIQITQETVNRTKASLSINKSFSKEQFQIKYIPIKINSSGVISLLITYLFDKIVEISNLQGQYFEHITHDITSFYFLTIVAKFTLLVLINYFYGLQLINVKELLTNMKNTNSFIKNIRPGIETTKNIEYNVLSSSIIGSFCILATILTIEQIQNLFNLQILKGFSGNLVLLITTISNDIVRRILGEISLTSYKQIKI